MRKKDNTYVHRLFMVTVLASCSLFSFEPVSSAEDLPQHRAAMFKQLEGGETKVLAKKNTGETTLKQQGGGQSKLSGNAALNKGDAGSIVVEQGGDQSKLSDTAVVKENADGIIFNQQGGGQPK